MKAIKKSGLLGAGIGLVAVAAAGVLPGSASASSGSPFTSGVQPSAIHGRGSRTTS